ncbi:hypothetical protein SAMN04489716_1290 [Actinoplanes derwentensis]|uniref:Uncharacterized protein n=1 Tax=Actinoplanes derwentensis TaxID=113562 RepID=A0A1H1U018_9ACTN|nr:hypothetical protein SAMN04489716_1290 [Actinoplanes derwentensis]
MTSHKVFNHVPPRVGITAMDSSLVPLDQPPSRSRPLATLGRRGQRPQLTDLGAWV